MARPGATPDAVASAAAAASRSAIGAGMWPANSLSSRINAPGGGDSGIGGPFRDGFEEPPSRALGPAGDVGAVAQVGADHGPVVEQHELVGQLGPLGGGDVGEQLAEQIADLGAVGVDLVRHRALAGGVLSGGVDEGAAAEPGSGASRAQMREHRTDSPGRGP